MGVGDAQFWTSPLTLFALGGLAAAIILAWNWRVSLPALLLIQVGLDQLMVARYGMAPAWAVIHVFILGLSGIILGLSMLQIETEGGAPHLTNWFFRAVLLALLGIGLGFLNVQVRLPRLEESASLLVVWLLLCGVLILALTDRPLHATFGLLLWFIPVQSLAPVILPVPPLMAILGSAQLLVVLACSYLVVAEDSVRAAQVQPITEVVFPVDESPQPVHPSAQPTLVWQAVWARFSRWQLPFKRRA